MTNNTQTINIIADNGGGITIQVLGGETDYQHYFQSVQFAAQTVFDAITALRSDSADEITCGWDGNDLDEDGVTLLNPSYDDVRNGGYDVLTDVQSITDAISWGIDSSWANIRDLSDAVYALTA